MTIRTLLGSALGLAAALVAAPIASAQLPQGVVLNPGERLVTPQAQSMARVQQPTRYATPQHGAPQYAKPQYVVPQSSGVVRVGGVQTYGGIQQANAHYAAPTQHAAPSAPQQGSMVGGSDQARAQQEANMMASRGIKGHVGGTIGAFEGVGWSSGGTPNTCTPGRAMRLTADAIARGPGGVYRVRAWR